jgi:hypothetical protein
MVPPGTEWKAARGSWSSKRSQSGPGRSFGYSDPRRPLRGVDISVLPSCPSGNVLVSLASEVRSPCRTRRRMAIPLPSDQTGFRRTPSSADRLPSPRRGCGDLLGASLSLLFRPRLVQASGDHRAGRPQGESLPPEASECRDTGIGVWRGCRCPAMRRQSQPQPHRRPICSRTGSHPYRSRRLHTQPRASRRRSEDPGSV